MSDRVCLVVNRSFMATNKSYMKRATYSKQGLIVATQYTHVAARIKVAAFISRSKALWVPRV